MSDPTPADIDRITEAEADTAAGVIALLDRIEALEAERDELHLAVNGCQCSPPYTECPHDEPLLKRIEALQVGYDTAMSLGKSWADRALSAEARLAGLAETVQDVADSLSALILGPAPNLAAKTLRSACDRAEQEGGTDAG
jgi:hypothetical protein